MKLFKFIPFIYLLFFSLNTIKTQEWVVQHPSFDLDELDDVYVSEDGNGWAVGRQTVLRTTNGGESWSEQPSNLSNTYPKVVHYMEGSAGMRAYAGNSFLFETTDGGLTWTQQAEPASTGGILDIATPAPGHIVLRCSRKIFHSADDGLHWDLVLETDVRFQSLSFGSSTDGWLCVQNGGLYHTSDSGGSWELWNSVPTTEDMRVSFVNETTGYADTDGDFYVTNDGGMNWTLRNEGAFSGGLYQLKAANIDHIYGYRGFRIYYSSDAGLSWDFGINISYADDYGNFHTLDDGKVWLPADYTSILHTNSADEQWEDQFPGLKERLQFVRFYNDNLGITGGINRTLLKTTDGGENWVDFSNPLGEFELYTDIEFINENEYLLAGDSIYYSNDGGQN